MFETIVSNGPFTLFSIKKKKKKNHQVMHEKIEALLRGLWESVPDSHDRNLSSSFPLNLGDPLLPGRGSFGGHKALLSSPDVNK